MPEEKVRLSERGLVFRLRATGEERTGGAGTASLEDAVERIVQYSLKRCTDLRARRVRQVESRVFVEITAEVVSELTKDGGQLPPGLSPLSRLVGLCVFRVNNRRYGSFAFEPPQSVSTESEPTKAMPKGVFNRLLEKMASRTQRLADQPTPEELLAILFGHMAEISPAPARSNGEEASESGGEPKQLGGVPAEEFVEMHSARRASLRDWQARVEEKNQEDFGRRATDDIFTYPVVDAAVLDNSILAVFYVSPLDPNFVDERVPEKHRVSEITLAFYQVAERPSRDSLGSLIPLLRQAFARVLFTNTKEQNARALEASFGESGSILRHWVKAASQGMEGLLPNQLATATFDPFAFCRAIVEKILCADIPDVTQMEIYPFNRVYVFKEAGVGGISTGGQVSRGKTGHQEPIEMLVIEASILSKNPEDRGRYLNRREQLARDRETFEFDPSQKQIKPEDALQFYVHGHTRGLVLSRLPRLTAEVKQAAFEAARSPGKARSRSQSQSRSLSAQEKDADKHAYPVKGPSKGHKEELSRVLYNLFGRLFPETSEEGEVEVPAVDGKPGRTEKTHDFTREFDQERLEILKGFDENGLSFRYSHALDLTTDAPLLDALQQAYFAYQEDKHKKEKEQLIREKLREKNLSQEAIEDTVKAERARQRKEQQSAQRDQDVFQSDRSKQAKVVYISFSSKLHAENRRLISTVKRGGEDREASEFALLGPEYTYSMILVSDQERGKSRAQLQAERNDLKLYFQMLMNQIWMAKLNEHKYLEKKSQSIGASLDQFIHRAKGMFPSEDVKKREQIQKLYLGLRRLVTPGLDSVTKLEVKDAQEFMAQLLGMPARKEARSERATTPQQADLDTLLVKKLSDLCPERGVVTANRAGFELLPTHLPKMNIRWSSIIARDAFDNVLKNAFEAAKASGQADTPLRLLVEVVPRDDRDNQQRRCFVDLVLQNPGGPIPKGKLERLNDPNPKPVESAKKEGGGMGIGIFLARFQLQNVIGDGCDIHFENIGDGIVQTRIRFPAEVVPLEEEEQPIEAPESRYVLYVEDEPDHYDPTLAALRKRLPDLDVIHVDNTELALEYVKAALPCAVMSDLHVPFPKDGGGEARMLFGASLLCELMKKGHTDQEYPPIWILSAEAENEEKVQTAFEEELNGKLPGRYHYVEFNPKAIGTLVEPGTICILNVKKPAEDSKTAPHFDDWMSALANITRTPASRDAATQEQGQEKTVEHLELCMPDFAGRLEAAWKSCKRYHISAKPRFVVTSQASSLDQVASAVQTWFGNRGIPNLEVLPYDEEKLRPLHKHDHTQWLVLVLALGESLFARLRIPLLYWGLPHNVWLAPQHVTPAEAANRWREITQDPTGPVAKIRHDVKGLWDGPQYNDAREEVTKEANSCEKLVLLSDGMKQKLETAFGGGGHSAAVLQELIGDANEVAQERDRIDAALSELDLALAELKTDTPRQESRMPQLRRTLEHLRNLIKGK